MAKKASDDSISEIEQELQAIKSSLRELKQENGQSPAPKAVQKAEKRSSKPSGNKELTATVMDFLETAESQRLFEFQEFSQALAQASQERKKSIASLKENCLQDRMQRLEWLKQMHLENEQTLQEFIERLESQCEKDRQDRFSLINQIRTELSEAFNRPV